MENIYAAERDYHDVAKAIRIIRESGLDTLKFLEAIRLIEAERAESRTDECQADSSAFIAADLRTILDEFSLYK